MPLFEKKNGSIHQISEQDILNRGAGGYVLYDIHSSSHYLYLVIEKDHAKQLLRFSIREPEGAYYLSSSRYHLYDAEKSLFDPTPSISNHELRVLATRAFPKYSPSIFFNKMDIIQATLAGITLNQENLEEIMRHRTPQLLIKALIALKASGISLDQNHLNTLIRHEDLDALTDLLLSLKKEGVSLNSDNLAAMMAHQTPYSPANAIISLKQADISLDQNHLNTLIRHEDPHSLTDALTSLKVEGISLNPEHLEAVIAHQNPYLLANILITLKKEEIDIDPNHLGTVIKDHDPLSLAEAFIALHRQDLLTQQPHILDAVSTFQQYIMTLPSKSSAWESKAEMLYDYTVKKIHDQSRHSVKKKEADALVQNVFNRAQVLWGTRPQASQDLLNVLLIAFALAGVDLPMMKAKKTKTGYGFFHIGEEERWQSKKTHISKP